MEVDLLGTGKHLCHRKKCSSSPSAQPCHIHSFRTLESSYLARSLPSNLPVIQPWHLCITASCTLAWRLLASHRSGNPCFMIGGWANPLPGKYFIHGAYGLQSLKQSQENNPRFLKEAPSRLRSFWGQVWQATWLSFIPKRNPWRIHESKKSHGWPTCKGTQFHQPLKSHPSCSTKSYRCTCTPRRSGGTGAGRSSQRPSNPVMVRNSASATWWYTTTAPYGTIAAVHGMHQNVSIGIDWMFFSTQQNGEVLHVDPGNLKVMTVSLDFPLGFWFNIITLR